MKKTIALLLSAAMTVGSCIPFYAEEAATEAEQIEPVVFDLADGELLEGTHHAKLIIEDYGTISLELDADAAPITVTNFAKLCGDDFYDGLTFHRIIAGFMMQGGDPLGNGMGGSEENIKGEFAQNGVQNDLSHTKGAISMARAMDPDSASSQFFICHEDADFLDGAYAVFGYVTEGQDIVDQICMDAEPVDNNGSIPAAEQPVIEDLYFID